MSVCLDSWAVLSWLDGEEPSLARVDALIATRPVISWVNLVEVYDRVERDHGRAAADEVLSELRAVLTPDLPGTARMVEAARLKARAAMALGDCFAVATAAARDLVLLTGDPEVIDLADRPCAVEDLRPAGSVRWWSRSPRATWLHRLRRDLARGARPGGDGVADCADRPGPAPLVPGPALVARRGLEPPVRRV